MKKKKTGYERLAELVTETVNSDSKDPNAFGVIVEGKDMSPLIEPGDIVVMEPNVKIKPGDIALVKLKNGQLFLRRLTIEGGIARLAGTSCADMDVPLKEIQWAYRASEGHRKF